MYKLSSLTPYKGLKETNVQRNYSYKSYVIIVAKDMTLLNGYLTFMFCVKNNNVYTNDR